MTEYTKIINQDDIIVTMNDTCDITKFKLYFCIKNNLINLKNILSFKLFELMGALNKDFIENIEIYKYNEFQGDTLLILKPIGQEIGIPQKYIYSNNLIEWDREKKYVVITSKQIPIIEEMQKFIPNKAESIESSTSVITALFESEHQVEVTYDFSMLIDSGMPRYMRKMPAKLMHNIFSRVKLFIENLNIDIKE